MRQPRHPRRRHGRDDDRQQAAASARPATSGRSRSSTATTSTTTSRATCSCPSAATPASRWSGRGTRSSPTASTSSSARSTGSTPDENVVLLEDGRRLAYDYLVIATGTTPRPDQTPGHARPGVAAQHLRLLHPRGRRGARRGARAASTAAGSSCTSPRCRSSARSRRWSSPSSPTPGCASAGMRDRVELVYVTPLDGAFTKPVASAHLGGMLEERKIARRDRLHGRADRPRAEDARLLRRARGPLRPAGHGPAEHGRRLRRPLRARRRAELRAGRQAHRCCRRRTTTSSRSATPPTSRPPRPARSRTSRSRSSSTTSSSTSPAGR